MAIQLFLSSCGVPKPFRHTLYFQDSVTEAAKTVTTDTVLIQPGDRLNIDITAINKEAAAAFTASASGTSGSATSGYLVDSLGNIQLLQLGVKQVAGFSTAALADSLERQLTAYLKDPIVTVNIVNFKVKVFGEVATPGVVNVPDGKITILDAIIQSGDLALFAKRQNILVIREENGKREFGRVDITSNHLFESPYYYLKQNDIIYVEADDTKYINNNPTLDRNLRNLAVATTLLSTVLLVINLVNHN